MFGTGMNKCNAQKVYGINLGATYSAIAVVNENGHAAIVPNAEGGVRRHRQCSLSQDGRCVFSRLWHSV